MSSEDEKKKALALETLAFAMLEGPHLVGRLAHMFVEAEDGLRDKSNRRRWDIDDRSVGEWLKTVYTAVRGEKGKLVESIITEAKRQKVIRKQRAEATAYQRIAAPTKDGRRNRMAKRLYKLLYKGYGDKEHQPLPPKCKFIAGHGDHLVAFNEGDHGRDSYVFVRNKRTGVSMLVSLGNGEKRISSFPGLCYTVSAKEVRAVLFTGVPVTVDLDRLSFIIGNDGRSVPWKTDGEPIITHGFAKVCHKLN